MTKTKQMQDTRRGQTHVKKKTETKTRQTDCLKQMPTYPCTLI